ncbi:MAG TPA: helix-turn-helix domain-containing protein [Methanomicrobiales archaeon]|nr:helix-turn-helix domain-containing protein [Methanomicrobiales archaeon]
MAEKGEETRPDRTDVEGFLTVEETAATLRINDEIVRRHIREGRLKAYKAGKFWRIPRREILRFLKMEHPDEATHVMPALRAPPAYVDQEAMYDSSRISMHQKRMHSELDLAESPRIYENRMANHIASLDEDYLDLDAYIARFEAMTAAYATKVMRSDDPFWEVTIASRTKNGQVIRKYIAAPGATNEVAVIEDLVDEGGSVTIRHFKSYRSFRLFVQEVLQRELLRIRAMAPVSP